MARHLFAPLVLLGSLVFAPVVQAGGPHFLAEAEVGIISGLSDASTTDLGGTAGVVLGIGGRPAGSWVRYYFLMEFLMGSYIRTHYQNFRTIELQRTVFDVGMGLRVVVPITPHIRFFGDVEGVLVGSSTEYSGQWVDEDLDSSELDGGFRFATGLHWRPIESLSLGPRFAMTTTFGDFDDDGGRGWLIGFDSEHGHWETTFQVTFYF